MTAHDTFENDDEPCIVIVDPHSEYKLIRVGEPVPTPWTQVGPPRTRKQALAWMAANWPDMYR